MISSAHEIIEKIVEASQAAVYKGYRKKNTDLLPAVKILKAVSLSAYQKTKFRHNIEQLKDLNARPAMTPIFSGDKFGLCLITQDCFKGIALGKLIEACYEKLACHAAEGHI